jgi:sugar phosphate isomerase/epimerase
MRKRRVSKNELTSIPKNAAMKTVSRKKFLLSGIGLLSLPYLLTAGKETRLKYSFSTLGCPDWSFDKILLFAHENGYSGIEVRGILRQMYLTHVPEFSNDEQIALSLQKMKDLGLVFTDLGSSAAMHHPDGMERNRNLGEAKVFIDLAAKLHCPFIRVFPNELPKDRTKAESLHLIIAGLKELGEYASHKNVTVLLESHGELVYKKDLLTVMEGAGSKHVGLVWDVCNMWIVTKESPKEVYAALKPYIRHTHIKDLDIVNGKEQYVLLGKGIVPIFQAIDFLYRNHYSGYYSFEWEKLWHPEILDPQIALADFPLAMQAELLKLQS